MGNGKLKKKLSFLSILTQVSILKSVYFNLKYFPMKTALKLPVVIHKHTFLRCCQGKVILPNKIYPGMIRIGARGLGVEDYKYRRTVWFNKGNVIFEGSAYVGSGSRLSVDEGAHLHLGNNFVITGASTIICNKDISLGNDSLLSWDVLLMDSDFHKILMNGKISNVPKSIIIGNHVWIGCRNTILKGVQIPDDVVIASNSVITHSVDESNIIIGGNRNNIVLKRNVDWLN